MTWLNLADNQLTSLKVGMFQGLVVLEYLILSGNNISSIEDNTFVNLTRLEGLFLNGNRLESLSPGTFCGLESIVELSLSNNRLTSLPQDVFIPLPRPLSPNPSGNPPQCYSALCWLKQEELNGTIKFYSFSKPSFANGVNWDSWSCNQPGDMFHINVLPHLNLASQGYG